MHSRRLSLVRPVLPDVSRVVVAWLFAVTGLLKVVWPEAAHAALLADPSIPLILLGAIEVVTALLLLSERGRTAGFVLGTLLIVGIGAGALVVGQRFLVGCGCLGAAVRLSALQHGVLLLTMSVLLFLAAGGRRTQ